MLTLHGITHFSSSFSLVPTSSFLSDYYHLSPISPTFVAPSCTDHLQASSSLLLSGRQLPYSPTVRGDCFSSFGTIERGVEGWRRSLGADRDGCVERRLKERLQIRAQWSKGWQIIDLRASLTTQPSTLRISKYHLGQPHACCCTVPGIVGRKCEDLRYRWASSSLGVTNYVFGSNSYYPAPRWSRRSLPRTHHKFQEKSYRMDDSIMNLPNV